MASIGKRKRGYRVRYRDPLGRQRSRRFPRGADADRFAREIEVDKDRGAWIDPRGADAPLRELTDVHGVGPIARTDDAGEVSA